VLGTEPQIVENYVKTGKVKLVFWHVLDFGDNSQAASEAAECAGEQSFFWEMHALLFERQSQMWRNPRQMAVELAGEVSELDQDRFRTCMTEARYAEKVRADDQARRRMRVRLRPTFDINGQRVQGALPYEQLSRVLDEALSK
jgi:protein-disulfide isomerase